MSEQQADRHASAADPAHTPAPGRGVGRTATLSLGALIGAFVAVEFTSGIIQGYYTPFLTNIARHLEVSDADVNWLEGAQLMLAAITVPLLSRLGDAVGHKRILLVSTAITALASFALVVAPSFPIFLVAWALQGFYIVWLPLEIALIWLRAERAAAAVPGARPAALTRRAAGYLVAGLELGAIAGALAGGALIDALPLQLVLLIPAIAVALCFFVILFGVRDVPTATGGGLDLVGTALLTGSLVAITGGLSLLRLDGTGSIVAWLVIAAGVALLWPFVRWELRHAHPLIDVRMFADPALWPVFLTAALFGMSVLGAQAPLSTFARTDPATAGYGLGTTGFATSLIIGIYLIALVAGAMLYPLASRLSSPRLALVGASVLVAIGYFLFLPFHDTYGQVVTNMIVAGIGSGALVAALPASAAAAAPAGSTGVATGLTNATKTVGGAIASCIFGLALASGVADAAGAGGGAAGEAATAGSFSGYVTVWVVCGASALVAAACLRFVPRGAFADAPERVRAVTPGA